VLAQLSMLPTTPLNLTAQGTILGGASQTSYAAIRL
jgi:hypothetical protein